MIFAMNKNNNAGCNYSSYGQQKNPMFKDLIKFVVSEKKI